MLCSKVTVHLFTSFVHVYPHKIMYITSAHGDHLSGLVRAHAYNYNYARTWVANKLLIITREVWCHYSRLIV